MTYSPTCGFSRSRAESILQPGLTWEPFYAVTVTAAGELLPAGSDQSHVLQPL